LKSSSRLWAMLASLAVVTVVGRNALLSLFQLAFSNPEYSHILLVPPVVLAFVFLERRASAKNGHPSTILGLVVAIAAAAAWLSARDFAGTDGLDLTMSVAALVLAVWAIVNLTYGWSFFRAALFPMLFLTLLIPWPASAVAKLTFALQWGSTMAAYWMFKISRVPVTRDGFVLSLPSMDIEVAKECSGIRSTVLLLVTALVLGQWYLRSGWRKTLLATAVFPIGLVRNGLRIYVLSMLATYVDEGWLEGNLHHRGGVVFFVLGLALVLLILWILLRTAGEGSQTMVRGVGDGVLAGGSNAPKGLKPGGPG
jgi:exosortase